MTASARQTAKAEFSGVISHRESGKMHGHKYDGKLEVVHFPSGAVPKIKEMSEKLTKQQCRE